jgi:hypothetical protein
LSDANNLLHNFLSTTTFNNLLLFLRSLALLCSHAPLTCCFARPRYHLPFDLKVGEMNVVASLTDVDGAPTNLKISPFHMRSNVGGIIDTALLFNEDNKRALRKTIQSFWSDPSAEAEYARYYLTQVTRTTPAPPLTLSSRSLAGLTSPGRWRARRERRLSRSTSSSPT